MNDNDINACWLLLQMKTSSTSLFEIARRKKYDRKNGQPKQYRGCTTNDP